jgi:zinc transport system permease protein
VIESFLIKPFLALILITFSCSLLGIFTLWKKLAYFGDGISHSILLGFVLGAIFNSDQISALIIFALFFAFLIEIASFNRIFGKDTLIAISSYFCIAAALILNDFFKQNLNLGSYIFGDILTVTNQDLTALLAITLVIATYTIYAFRRILLININADLAKIEGIKINFWNLSFTILLSLTIALSVRIVGVFLMTALLILPAVIARIFSTSAKQMIALSLAIGISITSLSFKLASDFNLTISATLVTIFCVIFFCSLAFKTLIRHG